MCHPSDVDDALARSEQRARRMLIRCDECHTTATRPAEAQTMNGRPGVCPKCWSENWQYADEIADQMLENIVAEIRRATLVREFVVGGAQ